MQYLLEKPQFANSYQFVENHGEAYWMLIVEKLRLEHWYTLPEIGRLLELETTQELRKISCLLRNVAAEPNDDFVAYVHSQFRLYQMAAHREPTFGDGTPMMISVVAQQTESLKKRILTTSRLRLKERINNRKIDAFNAVQLPNSPVGEPWSGGFQQMQYLKRIEAHNQKLLQAWEVDHPEWKA